MLQVSHPRSCGNDVVTYRRGPSSRLSLLVLSTAQSDVLAKFCNIPRDGLESCARMLIKFLIDEPVTASQRHLVAVKKKFLGERFLAVAIDELPVLPPKPHISSN